MTRTPKLLLKRFAFLVFGGGTLLYFLVWHRSATTVTNVRAACLWQHVSFNEPLNPKAGTSSRWNYPRPQRGTNFTFVVRSTRRPPSVRLRRSCFARRLSSLRGEGWCCSPSSTTPTSTWPPAGCATRRPWATSHRHVLFLTTDVATGQRLEDAWPDISVVSMNDSSFSGAQEYSKAGYVHLMVQRTRLVLRLVETESASCSSRWTSCGSATRCPPSCPTRACPRPTWSPPESMGSPGWCAAASCCSTPRRQRPGCGRALRRGWKGLNKQIAGRSALAPVSEGTNDQTFLSALIRERYGGVRGGRPARSAVPWRQVVRPAPSEGGHSSGPRHPQQLDNRQRGQNSARHSVRALVPRR